jgi:hypothetical protein
VIDRLNFACVEISRRQRSNRGHRGPRSWPDSPRRTRRRAARGPARAGSWAPSFELNKSVSSFDSRTSFSSNRVPPPFFRLRRPKDPLGVGAVNFRREKTTLRSHFLESLFANCFEAWSRYSARNFLISISRNVVQVVVISKRHLVQADLV